jgi:hypothetical protein
MKRIAFVLLTLATTGCNSISNGADSLGSHLPVIGEPCAHWQCITSEGREQSDAIKEEQQRAREQQIKDAQSPQPATPAPAKVPAKDDPYNPYDSYNPDTLF